VGVARLALNKQKQKSSFQFHGPGCGAPLRQPR
jgi:hypothetical protein